MKKRILHRLSGKDSERGIALILTLAILVMVTLLVVAFAISMRVENTASKNFNDLLKARQLAQAGVDQAVATIQQATTRNGANNILNYVTFPGVIYDYDGTTATPVPLYSVNAAAPLNINANFWITQTNGEMAAGGAANAQFNVGWIYVAEDGSVSPTPLNKPLVGRFAYWTDDEASKINLNTAGIPTPPPVPDYGTSSNQYVDLSMLLPSPYPVVPAITLRQGWPGYTSIQEIKLADASESDFTANRFSLTTYSNDGNYPDYTNEFDSLDQPRLVLANLHDTSPADSDILGTAGAGVSNAFTYLSARTLATMLSASGTPAAFASKYTAAGLEQIIANMIAYQINPAVTPPPDGSVLGVLPIYLGLAKTPYINEVQISYAISGAAPSITVQRTISVELFYMYDGTYTSAPGALGNEQIRLNNLPTAGGAFSAAAGPINIPASTVFNSGTYTVFTFVDPTRATLTAPTPIPTQTAVDGPTQIEYIRRYPPVPVAGTFHRLDYSQMMLQGVNLDPVTPTVYQGAQAADPCVNDTDATWQKYSTITTPTFSGTLGGRNVWLPTGVPPGNPPPPQNDPTRIMSAAYSFGYDFSKALMRTNAMASLGELGFIHTPFPGQYLRLQPQPATEKALGQIPDWAMLDLFTVGNAVVPNVTAGRININSFINPGATGPTTPRLIPLEALLNSASGMFSPTTVGQLAQQIYDDTPRSVGVDTYGMSNGRDGIFDTIGEICEATGVADNPALFDADREATVRRIANLITVRSNTFTIWVLAQTIKQPPTTPTPGTFTPGVDLITGEVRAQAVVERYESTPGLPGSVPKFRTRYYRYLYN